MTNVPSAPEDSKITTGRLEALTDATFAIIMTLLVLELRVPEGDSGEELIRALLHMLPSVLSFVISFIILGVYWTAHHTQFRYIKRLNHTLIWLNIFYLLVLSFVPFSAGLLGRHPSEQISVIVYAGNLLLATTVHFVLWRYGTHKHRLTDPWVDGRLIGFGSQISYLSFLGYLLAIFVSFWSVLGGIIILAILPLPFVLGLFYRLLLEE